mgnify:CR=1 FL=1
MGRDGTDPASLIRVEIQDLPSLVALIVLGTRWRIVLGSAGELEEEELPRGNSAMPTRTVRPGGPDQH